MAITKVTSGLISADASSIDLNIDAGTLYLDVSENRVGIGTSSPSQALEVTGITLSDGYRTAEDNTNYSLLTRNSSNTAVYIQQAGSGNILDVQSGSAGAGQGTSRLLVNSSGNVGIGTSSPVLDLQIGSATAGVDANMFLAAGSNAYSRLYMGDATTGTGLYAGLLMYDHGNDAMTMFTSSTERMRIDSSGKVHIGATTGTGILNVDGGTGEGSLYVEGTASGSAITARLLASDGGAVFFGSSSNHDLRIQTNGTNRMFITTSGTMGFGMSPLGTNNGSAFFDGNVSSKDGFMTTASDLQMIAPAAGNTIFVRDNGNESMRIDSSGVLLVGKTAKDNLATTGFEIHGSGGLQQTRDSAFVAAFNRLTTDGDILEFHQNTVKRGSISISGANTSYNTTSDARLKDVTGEARGLEIVNKLNPVSYNWKHDGKADEGLIAQEVKEIVPNAVSGSEEKYYQMDYSKLVTPLIKAIQEQQTIIDNLKTRIETLENA